MSPKGHASDGDKGKREPTEAQTIIGGGARTKRRYTNGAFISSNESAATRCGSCVG